MEEQNKNSEIKSLEAKTPGTKTEEIKTPTAKNSKSVLLILLIVVIILFMVMLTVLVLAMFYYQSKKNEQMMQTYRPAVNQFQQKQMDGTNRQMVADRQQAVGVKGQVDWFNEPQKVDLGIIPKWHSGEYTDQSCKIDAEYYLVGEIKKGLYSGYKIYNVGVSDECIMVHDLGFRLLVNDDQVVFVKGNEPLEDWEEDILKGYASNKLSQAVDPNFILGDLQYPEELKCGRNVLYEKEEYIGATFQPESYQILKKACDSQFGEVWMTDRVKADRLYENKEDKSLVDKMKYATFNSNAFYLKAVDGSVVKYTNKPDFLPAHMEDSHLANLPINWNDGLVSNEEYELNPLGCGTKSFAYDMTGKINLNRDLKPIGKFSNGDTVYGYKDITHPEFERTYDEIYWEEDGAKKSKEEYLARHPQIFWVDPYDRILSFYLTETISPAECGKPVIYLYPTKKQTVKVEVAPKNGLTITDPEYEKNGWLVEADPSGQLVNQADHKTYPYLFWEGHSNELLPEIEKGFVVTQGELDIFFNEKLSALGLNEQEINDFKEFWVPKMKSENKNFYLVTFLPQNFIHQLAPLKITPQPDTVIRVLMNYEGMDEHLQVEEQKLSAPERDGFTVVEWGGVLH